MFKSLTISSLLLIAGLAHAETAIYEAPVPVDRPELATVATMPVDGAQLRRKKSRIELKYNMPLALAGERKEFLLVGEEPATTSDDIVLASACGDGSTSCLREATAVCAREASANYRCEMRYEKTLVTFDQVKVGNYLSRTNPDAVQFGLKRDLSMFFSNEARGVLSGLRLR